jgi:hypothetical protein
LSKEFECFLCKYSKPSARLCKGPQKAFRIKNFWVQSLQTYIQKLYLYLFKAQPVCCM